jgi:hypothetical protein
MSKVDASTGERPSGMRVTESAGTTTSSACAPLPSGKTLVTVTTRSPTARPAPSPTASTTPAHSSPGT